ncbi:MAG: chorismate lyase [Hydrogenophaga sp.]|nr:chorismate lyase [Hydrogenophaga sp.]
MPVSPVWRPEHALAQFTTDLKAASWLTERGSLTQRLREHWGDAAVHQLDEGLATPLPHEAQRLGLPADAPAWIRCVLLVCGGQLRVYARTVIPDWSPHNPWTQVQHLGQQPLGELLFRLPDLQRSAFEWTAEQLWPHTDHWPSPDAPAPLGRRCVFVRESAPLLLTEVFLGLNNTTDTAT